MKRVQDLTFAATDLGDHLACAHLTSLDLLVANGKLRVPGARDPLLDILAERGRAHELAYREHLIAVGRRVVDGPTDPGRLLQLLEDGPDVVCQPVLRTDAWHGRADFLVRVDSLPMRDRAWSYEVVDTKLSAETRAAAVLQLCVYSELLADVQGVAPASMHVVHPGPAFPTESYRVAEFGAIYRQLRKSLEHHASTAPATYPDPVEHCQVCRWRSHCDAQRRGDDHPSLVAGLSRLHARVFAAQEARTMTAIAHLARPITWRPNHGTLRTYERLVDQARLQVEARHTPIPPWEHLNVEPGRGLARLPEPCASDLFIDFEGDPFIGEHGREFLFGCVSFDGDSFVYQHWWAFDDESERRAFQELMDFITTRWEGDAGMHIYHYAPYEPTALSRLRGRYASRGEQLDRLLRGKRFVDLYGLVRQAVRIGVESYGLKALEPVIGFRRERPLDETGPFHRRVLLALQRGVPDVIEDTWHEPVESYNRDDCLSAAAVRDWLEARRSERVAAGEIVPRPPLLDGRLDDHAERPTASLVRRLLEHVPVDAELQDPQDRARWTLAHVVEWYSRETRVVYAESHRRSALDDEARLEDPKSVGGLVHRGRRSGGTRSAALPVDVYDFPAQEIQIVPGDQLVIHHGAKLGEVVHVDPDAHTIQIRKTRATIDLHPSSAYVWQSVSAGAKEDALLELARTIADRGFLPPEHPSLARDLLMGITARGLSMAGASLRGQDEDVVACALRLTDGLNNTILPIQGPPGTGKTEIAARMILRLVGAGKRVGITATSHKVIFNLVERVSTLARRDSLLLRVLVKTDDESPNTIPTTTDASEVDRRVKRLHVVGATAWQWARPGMAASVDVLFVDEAGQMSLTDAIAIAGAASSFVLVGDPLQLQQPVQASHPDGLATSCLEHVLGGSRLVQPDRGLFLDVTHRLHPSVGLFTSEQFYEGRLHASEKARAQSFDLLNGPGLYFLPVEHHGNQSRASVEASAVVDLVAGLLRSERGAVAASEILVVAPYNAHVALLREVFEARGLSTVRVGTVDKFQGQEATVAIYSMATSAPEDAPRGLDFLYDRHRLNVATSRARCAAVLVASPLLLRPACKTPQHLRLASALCRFVELAYPLVAREP